MSNELQRGVKRSDSHLSSASSSRDRAASDGVLWAQEKQEWGWAGLGEGEQGLTAKGTGFPFGEMERLWNEVEVAAAHLVNVRNPPGQHSLKWTQRHMLCYIYVTTTTKKATGKRDSAGRRY